MLYLTSVEILEPAGGFERPVCRLLFGCSAIELHRPLRMPELVVL
jgi:hypothetical protein